MLPAQPEVGRRCATCAAPVLADDGYCQNCGYAQPGVAGGARPPESAVGQVAGSAVLLPTRPGSMRGIVVTGVSVGLVLVMAVATLVVRAVFFAPDDLVRAYFDALADRDADRAWSMLAGDTSGPRHPLLQSSTIDGSGYHPPADVAIERLSRDDGRAVADVTFQVEGQAMRLSLGLNPGRHGLLQRWEIDNGLFGVQVAGPADTELLLAGTRVAADRAGTVSGFPGGYTVALPDHPLLELPPTVAVTGGEPVTASAVLRDSGAQEIERQVYAYLDECLASGQLEPEGCQFSASEQEIFTTYLDVSWSLIEYPALSYEVTPEGSVYVWGSGGLANVTATADSAFSRDLDEVVDLVVEGWAVVDGDQVWFQPE